MILKSIGPNGVEMIYLNDDATEDEIRDAMMTAAKVPQGNGKTVRKSDISKEDRNGRS